MNPAAPEPQARALPVCTSLLTLRGPTFRVSKRSGVRLGLVGEATLCLSVLGGD